METAVFVCVGSCDFMDHHKFLGLEAIRTGDRYVESQVETLELVAA